MKILFAIVTTLLLLSGCAGVPQKEQHKTEISNLKNIEIFYHSDGYGVIVVESGGFFALASIGEHSRIEERSKAFLNAIQESFPDKDLNLSFVQKLAEKIHAGGREVKITKIDRPVGDLDIFKTNSYVNAPKTPGYAPLALRITTQYVANSFMTGFASVVDVKYQLGSADGKNELINLSDQGGGKGETYMQFDSLLAAHKDAYKEMKMELMSLTPTIYSNMFY
jgi:hypothetical protein